MAEGRGQVFKYGAFISHAREDSPIADGLRALLEERGIPCWIAPRNIVPGTEWAQAIIDGIDQSATLVLLISRASNDSPQVPREVAQALRRERPVFPILLEKVLLAPRLDYYIAPIHWVRYATESPERTADAIHAAMRGGDDWLAQAMPPGLSRRIRYSRKGLLSGVAAGLVSALAVVGLTWAISTHQRHVEMATSDAAVTSLGYVSLSAERPNSAPESDFKVLANVFLYGADTDHGSVRIYLTGVGSGSAPSIDLSSRLPPGVGAGASQIEFDAAQIEPTAIVCMSMPHPRLHIPYRVTQRYSTAATTDADGIRRVAFFRAAPDRVAPDNQSGCGR